MQNIIVQAGGRGSRLEVMTNNKPKALVPVNNLPIIFYLFKLFPKANYKIIADYKADIFAKYLDIFAPGISYEIIVPEHKGTASGVNKALATIDDSFMIIWCDLILAEGFSLPEINDNYIGLTEEFVCRWHYTNGEYIQEHSKTNAIAGLFVFKDKSVLKGLPESGAFVPYLKKAQIKLKPFKLEGTKEIGTILSYQNNENKKNKCRPFNEVIEYDNYIIKRAKTDQGKEIAKKEVNWYKFISKYEYPYIAKIYEYDPLKIKKINGDNVFKYKNFTLSQKKEVLLQIIDAIKKLHSLEKPISANKEDCIENYFNKTFDRIDQVQSLIPFARQKEIGINGKKYKNVFFLKEELKKKILSILPSEFCVIHGDVTFSNIMLETPDIRPVIIDPRGYFGQSEIFGDTHYDWAKLYYSIKGNYDQFNNKNFVLDIKENEVELNIESNGWEGLEELFFENIPADRETIKVLHAIIWLSLTTYAWEDVDSICGAFYKGVIEVNEIL